MNDLDKRAFEDAYSNIKAPADLKADTLEEMAREEEKYKETKEQKKESKSNRNIFYYGALAAALCAAVFCIFLLRPEGISYVTSMEEGVYYDEVELENGVIHFVANRVAISITPNAGSVVIGQEGTEAQEEIIEREEAIKTKSGGNIIFRERNAVSLPEIAEDNWSYIEEQKIYVTVLKTEKVRYQAVFERDGTAYEIIGEDVTQKEFIEELYQRVTEKDVWK